MSYTIKDIQEKLTELGLYTDTIDGINGSTTKIGIRAFQRLNGLSVDGIAGPKTLAKLFDNFDRTELESETDIGIHDSDENWPNWPKSNTQSLMSYYGNVGTNQTMAKLAYPMKIAWDKRKTLTQFQCNVKCKEAFEYIFDKVQRTYSESDINEIGLNIFGGCLNVRPMRGGTSYSTHSWGVALDLDPERNQLKWGKDRARLAKPDCEEFWKIVESTGATSLGRRYGYDFMHFEFTSGR